MGRQASSNTRATAFAVKYAPATRSFDPKAVEGLSEKLLVSHYDNNYVGAVDRLNAIDSELAGLDFKDAPVFTINGLKREQLVAANSMILHEVYFSCLGAGGDPAGPLAKALERDFGSVAKWWAEFASIGKALGGGSGWVLLSYSPRLDRLENIWSAEHTITGADSTVILALDMYEHAYQMDYGAKAAAYVDAYMKIINWPSVSSTYERLGLS
jgi:superoxide dismutase, Fe-Mn family